MQYLIMLKFVKEQKQNKTSWLEFYVTLNAERLGFLSLVLDWRQLLLIAVLLSRFLWQTVH